MNAVIIDTNVLQVANGRETQAPSECAMMCVEALTNAQQQIIALDNHWLILTEYKKNANTSGQPGVGDAFLLWLLRNQANPLHCEMVPITPLGHGDFAEFPSDHELAGFDLSDRKFVAVALTSRHDPEIVNAVDTDWWHFQKVLQRCGVQVRFLCPEMMHEKLL